MSRAGFFIGCRVCCGQKNGAKLGSQKYKSLSQEGDRASLLGFSCIETECDVIDLLDFVKLNTF